MIEPAFWFSSVLLIYVFLGYGALLYVWAICGRKDVRKRRFTPFVNVVIVAHNEESSIALKISNIFSQDYPIENIKVFVFSDGSTDRTPDMVRQFKGARNIELIESGDRVGKAEAINRSLLLCDSEFIVFADARQIFEKSAIMEMMSNFADDSIGAVSGELILRGGSNSMVAGGLDFYWSYEKALRRLESAIDSTVGATGAIYAIRKELFKPIKQGTLLDDVVIPMNVVTRGYRCVFEPRALAYDYVASSQPEEARRKIRTIAGNFQMFKSFTYLLNPLKNRIWLQTISHKFLRLLAPAFLLSAFTTNAVLARSPFFRAIFLSQVIFYSLSFVGYVLRKSALQLRIFSIPYAFVMLNLFTLKGFYRFLAFEPNRIWDGAAETKGS